jgi:hypothetical protein
MSQAISAVKKLKKLLDSRNNKFFFITALTLDLNTIDIEWYENDIVEKLNTINHCLNNNIIPGKDNKYIANNCFFCVYKNLCATI